MTLSLLPASISQLICPLLWHLVSLISLRLQLILFNWNTCMQSGTYKLNQIQFTAAGQCEIWIILVKLKIQQK